MWIKTFELSTFQKTTGNIGIGIQGHLNSKPSYQVFLVTVMCDIGQTECLDVR